MSTNSEKIQINLPFERCNVALDRTTVLLLLDKWEIEEWETVEEENELDELLLLLDKWEPEEWETMGEKNKLEVRGYLKFRKHNKRASITVSQYDEKVNETEVIFNVEDQGDNESNDTVQVLKKYYVFAIDERNIEHLSKVEDKISEKRSQVITNIYNKKSMKKMEKAITEGEKLLTHMKKEIEELEDILKDSSYHFTCAINILKNIVPDIENPQSSYWGNIQPLPQYTEEMLEGVGAEEELNLALGIGLNGLEEAKAKFILISLWLTKQIVGGQIQWQPGEELRNIPFVKPFAREIINITKKHIQLNPHNLEALGLQRAAYEFLENWEGVGETDHLIAKTKSLVDAGLIFTQRENLNEGPSSKRNDGTALEKLAFDLLQSMGLKATTTKTTGDGGIDILAYSESPVFSGKYIVQCKDYTGSVGETVIRDLYGVVMAESANKGILITTGTVTKSAQRFAEGKPLELIDGEQLSKLLQKYKIV